MAAHQYAMTPDVFSSPAIDAMRCQQNNGTTPVASFAYTAAKNKKSVTGTRIPIAPKERTGEKENNAAVGRTNIPSPSPWEEAIDRLGTVRGESFTQYINPLADVEYEDDGDVVVESGGNGESKGEGPVAFEMQTPEAVQILHKISTRIPLSNVNQNILDCYMRTGPKKLSPEPSMQYDILVPKVQQLGKGKSQQEKDTQKNVLESSEDENVVSDGEDKKETRDIIDFQKPAVTNVNEVVEIASPIMERGAHDSPGEVPPTLFPDQAVHTDHRRRDISPISFNLRTSPGEGKETSSSEGKSFSFGMDAEHEVTAQLLHVGEVSGGESVDQPNPFVSMMGRLRNEPACLKSPIIGNTSHPSTPRDTGESPKSPSNCTPMNLISASTGSKEAPSTSTPDLGRGNIDTWIAKRGLGGSVNTPTRKDLQTMWDAVRTIRETTEAYHEALKANAQLSEDLAQLQEAELSARIRAEEEGEIARHEIQKSQEISAQMMELSHSMYQEFTRCEEERRSLAAKLEEARLAIKDSSQDGAFDVQKELENLKAELASIRKAEALARAEAENAKSVVHEYEGKLKDAMDAIACMDIEESRDVDLPGVQDKVKYFEALNEHVCKSMDASGHEAQLVCAPLDDDLDCPATGQRAPQTTPVDIHYTTTPYRIFTESLNAFRESMDNSTSDEDGDSESEYKIEEISVSPIAADGLTRSTLRDTVRDRLFRLKTELEDAKSKLNHVELGLQSKQELQGTISDAKVELREVERAKPPRDSVASEAKDDEELATKREIIQQQESHIEDTYLPTFGQNDSDEGEVVDDDEFYIPATMITPASHRSRFARRLESMSTPMSLKRSIFAPKLSVSSVKSTAHHSPHCSSSSSCTSPGLFMDSVSRPRGRRLGLLARPKSESAEREFRRRAAAMKIHLSPYFKKSRPLGPTGGLPEIDSVL